jgi:hypothetical protein
VAVMGVDEEKVTFELTHAEALVLFEWLARTDSARSLPFEHESEEFVLWNIHNKLEGILSEPFESRYTELLAAARERVRKLAYGEKAP